LSVTTLILLFINELNVAFQYSNIASLSSDAWELKDNLYQTKGPFEKLVFRLAILGVTATGIWCLLTSVTTIRPIIFYSFILMQFWMLVHSFMAFTEGPEFFIDELHGSKGPLVWLSCSLIFIGYKDSIWPKIKYLLVILTNIAAFIILYKINF
jgi:hypothetical protein